MRAHGRGSGAGKGGREGNRSKVTAFNGVSPDASVAGDRAETISGLSGRSVENVVTTNGLGSFLQPHVTGDLNNRAPNASGAYEKVYLVR